MPALDSLPAFSTSFWSAPAGVVDSTHALFTKRVRTTGPRHLLRANVSSDDHYVVEVERVVETYDYGSDRKRPVFSSRPDAILFDFVDSKVTQRHDIPGLPGAFMLTNVLTAKECRQLIGMTEAMGYTPFLGLATLIWMADDSLQVPIFERIQAHMPAEVAGSRCCGLHRRWRAYRYEANDLQGAHFDGSQGAVEVQDGQVVDCRPHDQWSQLSFLLYLNEDFAGGETSFFLPHVHPPTEEDGDAELQEEEEEEEEDVGGGGAWRADLSYERAGRAGTSAAQQCEVVRVKPAQGSVLCFYQQGSYYNRGTAHLSPLHEGTEVLHGVKYVIRSDVMYRLPRLQQA